MTKAAPTDQSEKAAFETNTDAIYSIADVAPTSKEVATLIAQLALVGHAVHKGQHGDYLVSKHSLSKWCQDFKALQDFAKQLGVIR